MGLFKNIFGKGDVVAELARLHGRQEWAALLSAAKQMDSTALPIEVRDRVTAWVNEAGDQLAQINLTEGASALHMGNHLKACEHLQLAVAQATSASLRDQAEQLLSKFSGNSLSGMPVAESVAGCNGGCSDECATDMSTSSIGDELDAVGRLELLLATLPDEFAAQYVAAGTNFLQGWLAAQEGDDARALELFAHVPETEQSPLFRAERGVVYARTGQWEAAEADLRIALEELPELFHPFDALVSMLAKANRHVELETLLRQNLAEGRFSGYCWAKLAQIEVARGNSAAAFAACSAAINEGEIDPASIIFCAQLHEHAGQSDEAESLLAKLPSGGCGGGVHPLLAEFWLHHGKHLDRALETFKGALRHEPANARWLLRIAQVYIAKGWKREAIGPIESLLRRDDLPSELAEEARSAAEFLKG